MIEFKIKVAGITISVKGISEYLKEYCRDYIVDEKEAEFQIAISEEDISRERRYSENNKNSDAYIEIIVLLRKIADTLPEKNRFLMHGAVVEWNEKGYMFTAPSGTGKTTHIQLWKKFIGEEVRIINGDKPILEIGEQEVLAYGTPWAGKERFQQNKSVSLKKICFLRQGTVNRMRRLEPKEALKLLIIQIYFTTESQKAGKTLELFNELLKRIPVYELTCNISQEAAEYSFQNLTETTGDQE